MLVRQCRYLVREWLWEVLAGSIGSEEDPEAAAQRELAEEIGGVAGNLHCVGHFFSAGSISDFCVRVFLATNVHLGESSRETTELIEIK